MTWAHRYRERGKRLHRQRRKLDKIYKGKTVIKDNDREKGLGESESAA